MMDTKRTVKTRVWQHVMPYEDDAQAQRFFRGGFPYMEPIRALEPGVEFGELVRELVAYANVYDGFETWYVVKETNSEKLWLMHSANVYVYVNEEAVK